MVRSDAQPGGVDEWLGWVVDKGRGEERRELELMTTRSLGGCLRMSE